MVIFISDLSANARNLLSSVKLLMLLLHVIHVLFYFFILILRGNCKAFYVEAEGGDHWMFSKFLHRILVFTPVCVTSMIWSLYDQRSYDHFVSNKNIVQWLWRLWQIVKKAQNSVNVAALFLNLLPDPVTLKSFSSSPAWIYIFFMSLGGCGAVVSLSLSQESCYVRLQTPSLL